jgi:hypothetical protein
MKIAVLSLTRDRLAYTQHCFTSLRENAGCAFHHSVLDQGSNDGTSEWLHGEFQPDMLVMAGENVGISCGLNTLIDDLPWNDFDVIVKFDNDCELLTPNTLRDIALLVDEYGLLLSPQIHGLRQPPATIGLAPLSLGGALVDEKAQIGGIFLAAPAWLYDDFRYSEANPLWGGDDVEVCAYWRGRGMKCGYVQGYDANHYLTSDGQYEHDRPYFDRKVAEMAKAMVDAGITTDEAVAKVAA